MLTALRWRFWQILCFKARKSMEENFHSNLRLISLNCGKTRRWMEESIQLAFALFAIFILIISRLSEHIPHSEGNFFHSAFPAHMWRIIKREKKCENNFHISSVLRSSRKTFDCQVQADANENYFHRRDDIETRRTWGQKNIFQIVPTCAICKFLAHFPAVPSGCSDSSLKRRQSVSVAVPKLMNL